MPAEWLADSEVALTGPERGTFVLPGEPIVDARLPRGRRWPRAACALQIGADATIEEIERWAARSRRRRILDRSQVAFGPRRWRGARFVVANGAEGEPATFKDRMLMRLDPYRIVEGAAIAALRGRCRHGVPGDQALVCPRGRGVEATPLSS